MRNGLSVVLLAAGLAGCGATAQDYRDDKEQPLPSGQGMFGQGFTWEWRKKDPPAPPSAAPATTAPAAPSAGNPAGSDRERQEFEEWRAWQEWKRKNEK